MYRGRAVRFLEAHGLTVPQVLEIIGAYPKVNVVYAAGSVVEGFETSRSDLDVYHLLDSGDDSSHTWPIMRNPSTDKPLRIDIETLQLGHISAVIDKLHHVSTLAQEEPLRLTDMSISDYSVGVNILFA